MRNGRFSLYMLALFGGLAAVLVASVYMGLIYDRKKVLGQLDASEGNSDTLESQCLGFPCSATSCAPWQGKSDINQQEEKVFIVRLAKPLNAKPGGTFKGQIILYDLQSSWSFIHLFLLDPFTPVMCYMLPIFPV